MALLGRHALADVGAPISQLQDSSDGDSPKGAAMFYQKHGVLHSLMGPPDFVTALGTCTVSWTCCQGLSGRLSTVRMCGTCWAMRWGQSRMVQLQARQFRRVLGHLSCAW